MWPMAGHIAWGTLLTMHQGLLPSIVKGIVGSDVADVRSWGCRRPVCRALYNEDEYEKAVERARPSEGERLGQDR